MPAKTPEPDSEAAAKAAAVSLLSRREHSRLEIERKLRARGFDAAVVEAALARLVETDLVSDRRFAESFARGRVARLQGPRKIRAELGARGVDDADIAEALAPWEGEWPDLALAWLQRRCGAEAPAEDKPRLYRALANRGFTHGQAMEALNSFIANP